MKKLVLFLGLVCLGNLFAATAEDAPIVSSTPQRTILDILPREVITGPIFDLLSECDITAFTSVNRHARSLRKSVVIDMLTSPLTLERYKTNVSSIKITNLHGDKLLSALRQLEGEFRFWHLNVLDVSGYSNHGFPFAYSTLTKRMPNLIHLNISNTSIDDVAFYTILDTLPNLETLEAERLKLDPRFFDLKNLRKLKNLRILKIRDNQIQDEGAKIIGENLKALEILDVSNNGINFEGAHAIVTGLPGLKKLNIAENGVGASAKKDVIFLTAQDMISTLMKFMRSHNLSPPPETERAHQLGQQVYKWANAEAEEEIRLLLPHTGITF